MATPKVSIRVPEDHQKAIKQIADERSVAGTTVYAAEVYREAIERFLRREGHLTPIPQNGDHTSRDSKFHFATD